VREDAGPPCPIQGRITIKALASRGTSRCSRPLFKKPG
jgi:hypothetical protein